MTTVPPGGGASHDTHRFICTGCHTRFTSVRDCPVCESPVVPLAELTYTVDRSMQPPRAQPHVLLGLVASGSVVLSIGLAWGYVTIWGVVPCAVLTSILLFAPIARWERREPGDELGAMLRQAPSDGHPMVDGSARQITAVTSTRLPTGCAGMLFGIVFPLVTIRPEHPATVIAGLAACVGFVVAWLRRIRREGEVSAGKGVPL